MKKLIVILLTVSFLFVGQVKGPIIKASSGYLENLLDLTNIIICDEPEDTDLKWFITTKEAIVLEEGSIYTLVLDKDLFHYQTWNSIGFEGLEAHLRFYDPIDDKSKGLSYGYTIVDYEYCYITFTSVYSLFSIFELPVDGTNFNNIMLYKGDINSFDGNFVSFNSNNEPIKGVYVKDYDIDLSVEEILSSISTADDFTDDITYVVLEDEYSLNKDEIGEFNVKLLAIDEANNRAFYNLIISIIDVTDPVITGIDYYKIELNKDAFSIDDIRRNISFRDNVTDFKDDHLVLVNDEYTSNSNFLGVYNVLYKVTDEAGNYSVFEVMVEVVDTTPPTITGPVLIYRYTTDPLIDESYIRSMFSAYDLVDGDVTEDIIITGDYNNVPGHYEMQLSATDKSGNTATKTLIVNVVDGSMPRFISDDLVLTWNYYSKMDHEELKTWLNENIAEGTSFKILFDETLYNKNSKKETHIYYSFEHNGQTHYGRLVVLPQNNKITNIVVSSVLGLVNLVFIFFYFKRPKVHL